MLLSNQVMSNALYKGKFAPSPYLAVDSAQAVAGRKNSVGNAATGG